MSQLLDLLVLSEVGENERFMFHSLLVLEPTVDWEGQAVLSHMSFFKCQMCEFSTTSSSLAEASRKPRNRIWRKHTFPKVTLWKHRFGAQVCAFSGLDGTRSWYSRHGSRDSNSRCANPCLPPHCTATAWLSRSHYMEDGYCSLKKGELWRPMAGHVL